MSGEMKDFIDFVDELISLERVLFKRYRKEFEEIYAELEVKDCLKKGKSIIKENSIKFKKEYLLDPFDKFTSFLYETSGIDGEILKIRERFSSNPSEIESMLKAFIRKDERYFDNLLKESSIDIDIILFLSENILRPYAVSVSNTLKGNFDYNLWNENTCPVCGSEPVLSGIRKEDGKRFLYCSLCGMKWQFKRLKCPWCLNEDFKKLGFLTIEESNAWRIDVCEKCKGYIRTMDERRNGVKLPEPELEEVMILDAKTRYLDSIAIEKGYEKYLKNKSEER